MRKTFAQKNWPLEDKNAIAYQLNFVSIAYGYDSDKHECYFTSCCRKNNSLSIHFKDFEYPKTVAIQKPYFQLDWYFYAVSEELKNAILSFGIDDKEEDVFRPVWTRKHDKPICYSIEPRHILMPIAKENNYETEIICKDCDIVWAYVKNEDLKKHSLYNGLGPPIYVSSNILEDLHDFNVTYEYFGPRGFLVRDVIVSKRICEFILSLYPRAEFRPVVIKGQSGDKTGDGSDKTGDGSVSSTIND